MSAPLAMQVAKNIGDKFGATMQKREDTNAIESILAEAAQTDDPQVMQNTIGKILSKVSPERQGAAIKYLETAYNNVTERKKLERQREASVKYGGSKEFADLPPGLQTEVYKQNAKNTRLDNIYGDKGITPAPNVAGTPNVSTAPQQEGGNPLQNKTNAELELLTGHPDREISEPAKAVLKGRQEKTKVQGKEFEADRNFHSKSSEPVVAEANEILKKAPIRKGLINQQRRDIASGNTAGILPFLAEKTGVEIWRTPEAARFKTASKQRFIENLASIGGGARPNMFIEQQLVGAQAALGRDAEANQTVLDMEEFIDDLESQRAKYVREIATEDRAKYGYVKNDVAERADDKMEKYADQRQNEMAYAIRKRREDNLSDEQLVKDIVGKNVTQGTPLTVRAARILMIKNNYDEKKAQAEALKLGFEIPTDETYKKG